jgi:hypothetical protein
VLVIGCTDQARDMVIASGLPSNHDLRLGLPLVIWALVSWYWARVTLRYTFVNPPLIAPTEGQRSWWQFWTLQIPRLLGAACIASIAWTFHEAARLYTVVGDKRAAAFDDAQWYYAAGAVLFYVAVASRQSAMTALARAIGPAASVLVPSRASLAKIRDLGNPLSWFFLSVTFFLAPVAFFAVLRDPVGMSVGFGGAVPALLAGLALIAPVTSTLLIVSARSRVPFFGIAAAALSVAPFFWSDNHDIRTCRTLAQAEAGHRCLAGPDHRLFLGDAFEKWWDVNAALTAPITSDGQSPVTAPPMIVVAAAGGASRAAYWTSQVLGQIAGREDDFADRLFMISAVSGGSLGAVMFRSIIEADRRRLNKPDGHGSTRLPEAAARLQQFIKHDFLGPALATGLYVDFPSRAFAFLLPPEWRPDDRAAALEKAWEEAWEESGISTGHFTWKDGFNGAFAGLRPWPVLALNGTSVERGKRIITSNVQYWSGEASGNRNLSSGIDHYDTFYMTQSDIPISTSVTMSARFPLVSPTGAIKDRDGTVWTRVTDGGLFENFGAATAEDVLRYLTVRHPGVRQGKHPTIPIAILISSDPSFDSVDRRRDGDPNAATPDCAETSDEPLPKLRLHAGNRARECPVDAKMSARLLFDPAEALESGRKAHGRAAVTALQDRIIEARLSVRPRLLKAMTAVDNTGASHAELYDKLLARVGLDDHVDFFHFRQCRVDGSRGPTMSWHDSAETWDVVQKMLGLTKGANGLHDDPCGNQIEFFRLCVRLARLTGAAGDDHKATDACEAKGWPKPPDWRCDDAAHDGKRPYCRLVHRHRGDALSRHEAPDG